MADLQMDICGGHIFNPPKLPSADSETLIALGTLQRDRPFVYAGDVKLSQAYPVIFQA